VLAPVGSGKTISGRLTSMDIALYVFGVMAVLSVLLLTIAILAVRRVTLAQAGQAQRRLVPTWRVLFRWRGRSWLPRPPLDWNPVLWREWQRRRATLVSSITWTIYVLLAARGTRVSVPGQRGAGGHWSFAPERNLGHFTDRGA
jgi:hypothetical protein